MKRIWAPWRMKFVQTHTTGCIFCSLQKNTDGPENLIIFRGQNAFVILNRFPYTSGHLMVVANAHQSSLEDLQKEARAEMMELANKSLGVLRRIYHPDGFNMGANIGEAAGAGVVGHVHLHLVPRWTGDTNFMLTLAETKVMPEALEDTFRRVCAEWETS
jgi:ATP adenylyltransferase